MRSYDIYGEVRGVARGLIIMVAYGAVYAYLLAALFVSFEFEIVTAQSEAQSSSFDTLGQILD